MDGREWFLHLMFLKPWMGEGGFFIECFYDLCIWIWIIPPPLENDGLHHFTHAKKKTHDYNVSIAKEEKGFVWLTHNHFTNDNLLVI